MTLHVSSFGGGVVIEGAADQRRISEVLRADSFSIGARGALVVASDASDYTTLEDGAASPAPWSKLHQLLSAMPGFDPTQVIAIGEGEASQDPGTDPYGSAYLLRSFLRDGEGSTVGTPQIIELTIVAGDPPQPPSTEGVVVTGFAWPGVWTIPGSGPDLSVNVALICIGAREGFAPKSNVAFGLYFAVLVVGSSEFIIFPSKDFNCLGTGPFGDGVDPTDVGSDSQQLYFRGVVGYNDHAFGWGFDSADTTNGDGPARVMFCNQGLPLKWGNDNQAASGNRFFTDSDAITLGGRGEIVRAGCAIFGRLYLGTNKGLHFITGYGRESFLTDGFKPVTDAYNTCGPHGLIEGPDKKLYGTADIGLWRYSGEGVPEPLFLKLVDFAGNSNGYWDLIWTDRARATTYPGRTNQDLVWMTVDWDAQEILVGIPWCDAEAGEGYGLDTVVIRFNVRTEGFSRQVFEGVQYTSAAFLRHEGQFPAVKFFGTATAGVATIRRYGYAADGVPPMLPLALPRAVLGPYAPFGPDGDGVTRRVYLTLAWESADALPLAFDVVVSIDESEVDSFALYIGPTISVAVAVGSYWVDTSQTDTNLGNATAGAAIPARGGYLLKVKQSDGSWLQRGGMGQKGTRVTIPLGVERVPGARVTVDATCTAAIGRFQWEGLGLEPGGGSAAG